MIVRGVTAVKVTISMAMSVIMPLNSPGGSTLQWGTERDLLCLKPRFYLYVFYVSIGFAGKLNFVYLCYRTAFVTRSPIVSNSGFWAW